MLIYIQRMKKNIFNRKFISIAFIAVSIFLFNSCSIQTRTVASKQPVNTAALSNKLGVKIGKGDYIPFFNEAAKWIGTPYRSGGSSRAGVDCSGFVSSFYNQFFKTRLDRNSSDIFKNNCYRIRKSKLKPGDLVFFHTGRGYKINHVGIYLKDGKFIHSSTSRGVIVSDLNEDYYKKTWKTGGRVKI